VSSPRRDANALRTSGFASSGTQLISAPDAVVVVSAPATTGRGGRWGSLGKGGRGGRKGKGREGPRPELRGPAAGDASGRLWAWRGRDGANRMFVESGEGGVGAEGETHARTRRERLALGVRARFARALCCRRDGRRRLARHVVRHRRRGVWAMDPPTPEGEGVRGRCRGLQRRCLGGGGGGRAGS